MTKRKTLEFHGTTIVGVRHNEKVAMGGDGQVTLGQSIMKHNSTKIRKLYNDTILTGFAGGAADAFTLFERFEEKLERFSGNLPRVVVELAKDWRTDRMLRKLEAMMIVANEEASLVISGTGDVIDTKDDLLAIGSGGSFAQAAARALFDNTELSARDVVEKSLNIAGDICIYTNQNLTIEEIEY